MSLPELLLYFVQVMRVIVSRTPIATLISSSVSIFAAMIGVETAENTKHKQQIDAIQKVSKFF